MLTYIHLDFITAEASFNFIFYLNYIDYFKCKAPYI